MTKEETIKWMHKSQLIELISSTLNDINIIHASVDKIQKQEESMEAVNTKINWEEGFLQSIILASKEIDEKLDTLRAAYNELLINDKDNLSIKTQIEELLEEIEDHKTTINKFKDKVFGTSKNEEGETIVITKGLEVELDEFFTNWKKVYEKLIADIETRLSPGATSVELATTFREKVDEFKKSAKSWGRTFIAVIGTCVIYFAAVDFFNTNETTLTAVWIQILHRSHWYDWLFGCEFLCQIGELKVKNWKNLTSIRKWWRDRTHDIGKQ